MPLPKASLPRVFCLVLLRDSLQLTSPLWKMQTVSPAAMPCLGSFLILQQDLYISADRSQSQKQHSCEPGRGGKRGGGARVAHCVLPLATLVSKQECVYPKPSQSLTKDRLCSLLWPYSHRGSQPGLQPGGKIREKFEVTVQTIFAFLALYGLYLPSHLPNASSPTPHPSCEILGNSLLPILCTKSKTALV